MAPTAIEYKEKGNRAFQLGDYEEAEKIISKDPSNAIFYTNRAFARLRLETWDSVLDDCLAAIERDRRSLKGFYYLAQAQLALRHPNEALTSALTAYDLCLRAASPSTAHVVALVLQAKKMKWEARERERLRHRAPLLAELEDRLTRAAAKELEEAREQHGWDVVDDAAVREEVEEIEARGRRKVEELRSVFAISDPSNLKQREVPEYMIDSITFAFMHDPVITPNGHSYERATIQAHLKVSSTDPLTRAPLRKEDLRPNLALKEACAAFLEDNGWAVDW